MLAPRVDKLNRRFRFAPVQRKGKRTLIDDDDISMWSAIHAHGPLPTHYLTEFTSKKNYNTHQHRLTKQRNGTEEDGPYLVRCPTPASDPLSTVSVYKLHDNAIGLLKERGIYSKHSERRGWIIHQLMGSCVTASIELQAVKRGITFIPRHEILTDNGKPLNLPLPNSRYLAPDELFGLNYGEDSRYFVCEWDRNSEPFKRDKSEGVDFVSKLKDYIQVIKNGGLKKNTKVLIVTTSSARAQSIKAFLADTGYAHLFILNVLDYFAHPWRIPPVLADILEPWERADGKPFDITIPYK